MSEVVHKTSVRPADGTRPASPSQEKPRIHPDTTIQKASADPAAAAGSPTSYSGMLAEAYDGDTTEALAAALGPRRTGEDRASDYRLDDAEARTERARPRATPPQASPEDSSLLDGMRRRQAAGAIERYSPAVPAAAPPVSAKELHETLILASSDKGQAEIASHINFQTFRALTQILSKRKWVRVTGIEQHLVGRQMASVPKATGAA